ncbi:MAG: glycosyltransferase family 4 protein [Candidatus Brocadiaceae bacterium]|nr:glycosyltransferase family 4 protein [Candidatus Brocadiaceae bacterium]
MADTDARVKKVLLVAPRMQARGTSEYTVNLARELKAAGLEVAVFCGPGRMLTMLEREGIPFRTFPYIEGFGLRCGARRSFLAAIAGFDPQIIHVQGFTVARALHPLRRGRSAALVLTAHWVPARCRRLHRLTRCFHGIIATTQDVREELVNDCGVARGRVRVIPNGIDVARLEEHEVPPIFRNAVPAVGSLGPIEEERGHELFVRAAAIVMRRWPAVQFVIAGEGRELPGLTRLVGALGLDRAVTLARDLTAYEDVLDALDVVVQSSQVDVSGYSILEAMGHGRPVIAFNTGTACEIIEDRRTGLLVPKGEVEALAGAMESLIGNPSMARQMGQNARQAVRDKFDVRTLARQTLDYYTQLLSR